MLQRFREYDEDRSKNERIFEFTTSSNNRDGLAVRAAAEELLNREEEKKILILLSDGKPYDVVVNRPNARNPRPYEGTTRSAIRVRQSAGCGIWEWLCWEFSPGKRGNWRRKKRFLAKILPISDRFQTFLRWWEDI